jgi:hypothetical protein
MTVMKLEETQTAQAAAHLYTYIVCGTKGTTIDSRQGQTYRTTTGQIFAKYKPSESTYSSAIFSEASFTGCMESLRAVTKRLEPSSRGDK